MSVLELVKQKTDQRTTKGRNMRTLAQTAEDHKQSGLGPAIENLFLRLDEKGIEKLAELDIKFHGTTITEQATQQCALCGQHGLKTGIGISLVCNHSNIYEATAKPVVGINCFEHLVQIKKAMTEKELEPIEFEKKKSTKTQTQKPTIALAHLTPDITDILASLGYDLQSTIPRDKATQYENQIRMGDYTGITAELDPAKNQDLLNWILGQYEPEAVKAKGPFHKLLTEAEKQEILYTALLLANLPEEATPEQKRQLTNIYDQTRPTYSRNSLQNTIDDIEYLAELTKAKLPKDDKRRALIEKPVHLDHQAMPRTDHKKTQPQKLEDLIRNTAVLTAAQATMMTLAVPKLRERRQQHNQIIMDSLADKKEWDGLLNALEQKYAAVKDDYHKAKKAKIQTPEFNWKNYTPIKELFEGIEIARKIDPDYSIRKHILHTTTMRKANDLIKQFYIEARKVQLANNLGNDELLRQQYMTIDEAMSRFNGTYTKELLLRLPKIAIEEHPTTQTKKTLNRMPKKQIQELVEELQDTLKVDLIPTKYVQNGKLERALKIAENYTESQTTTEQINYIIKLEEAKILELGSIDAETGKPTKETKKRFRTSDYQGKTHFTQQQIETIARLHKTIATRADLQEITDQELAEFRKAKEYFQKNTVLDKSDHKKFTPNPQKLYGFGIVGTALNIEDYKKTLAWYAKRNEHTPLTEELRRRLQYLQRINAAYNLDNILKTEILLTKEAKEDIDARYQTAIQNRINEGSEHYKRSTFTVAISGKGLDTAYRGKGLKLREAKSTVHLGRHTTIEQGEWYGQGINKTTLNTIVEQLPENAEIRIKPD